MPFSRGVDAAQELIKRGAKTDDEKTLIDNCTYVLPFFLQKIDRKPEAAEGFLDFVDAHKADAKDDRVQTAFNNAIAIVGGLVSHEYRRSGYHQAVRSRAGRRGGQAVRA